MNSDSKKHIQTCFDDIHNLAGNLTKDYRSLAHNSNVVCAGLRKLFDYDQLDHSIKMTYKEQEDIVECLRTVCHAAGQATNDSRVLAIHTMYVLNALNELFIKEGLEPVKVLFPKDTK